MNVRQTLNNYREPCKNSFKTQPVVTIGGIPIAVVSRDNEAELILEAARTHPRGERPLYFTSANGEVIARINADENIAKMFLAADQIVADGQPMVFASKFLCEQPLPERVATTDLFHDVAKRAEQTGQSFYFLGASPIENAKAVAAVKAQYPKLNITGSCHGFLKGDQLDEKLAKISAMAPDILWLAMGVPAEQIFIRDHAHKLSNVGLIKTSGGLFNFLSGCNQRAPEWMQKFGLEWAFRMYLEPRRLAGRYFTTNGVAMFHMLTRSH